MNNQQAYNVWSKNYDAVENKTRDLEAFALRETVGALKFKNVLEIGCGTGKNTEWLAPQAEKLVAVDFSAEMLAKAKAKIAAENVEFRQLDLRETWNLPENEFDLIVCSLALEHIENLEFVFDEAAKVLRGGGHFYIGELHPFKQYQGSKARFEIESETFELECFTHHVSDFFKAARNSYFSLIDLREWFDDADRTLIPRLLTLVFRTNK